MHFNVGGEQQAGGKPRIAELGGQIQLRQINGPLTRGMRRNWFAGVEALMSVIRVLPPDLYDKVISGKPQVIRIEKN